MLKALMPFLVVGAGGFAGSALRYLLSVLAQRYSISFPHGTLWANLLGCLTLGVIASVAAAAEVLSPTARLLLATGFCGGFTTMSSFIYELVQFARDQEYLYAAGYLAITLGGCTAAFCLGLLLVKLTLKP